MFRVIRTILVASTVLVACDMSVTAAQLATGTPVKVGAVLSMTTPGAGLGGPERNSILLAVKQTNANGGIQGRPLQILIEDDGSKTDIVKSKAEALIYGEKVVAMRGPSLTASTGAVATVTNRLAMPQLCMTGLGPTIEPSCKSLFHMLPPQSLNARAMLEHISKGLSAKKIGLLYNSGDGQLVLSHIDNQHQEYGVEIVAATMARGKSGRSNLGA